MAGIYIHIPYCHKACHYCNFHFSTSLKDIQEMTDAICKELLLRKTYLPNLPIQTIYFGGGTPSVLSADQLNTMLDAIHAIYSVDADAEITLEANPEDITEEILQRWKEAGVNRLSIGIQSFQDKRLSWMNRNHTGLEAVQSVKKAQEAGFENISIDLIYGLPGMSVEEWKREIQTAVDLRVPHISSYCLTIEDKTVFGKQLQTGLLPEIPEELSESHLLVLMDALQDAGFEQYEISNFCKPSFESRHNSSYWKREPYVGIGPGAHSYNLISRHATISNNALYLQSLHKDILPISEDPLTDTDHYHEYVLTRLRTKWGISLEDVHQWIPSYIPIIEKILAQLQKDGFIVKRGNVYLLSSKGKLLADEITLKLML
ncbi:MAG: radical SAM family heme chaperone HemW [Cytophagales bacterium]|nr:radical SAM family heme chaperone HemW [Cytophaga sp.]